MHNTLSPSKFMLIQQDTQRSSVPSEISQNNYLPTLQSQSQERTNQLLSKTLKYLNKSHDLALFSKKILVPKVRRNTFLEQSDKKRQAERAQKLLQMKCKKAFQMDGFKSKFHKNSQNNQDKQFGSIFKSKSRKKQKSMMNQTSISLSKIQILQSLQKEQTIAEQNLDNENYLFLNSKHEGKSESDKEDEPYLYPSQVPQQPKLRFQKSFAIEASSFFRIRPKVKSMSKYDREKQQSIEKSMNYRSGPYEKGNTLSGIDRPLKNDEVSPFIKLIPIVPSFGKLPKQEQQSNDTGNIFSTIKSLLIPNASRIQRFGTKPSIKDQQLLAMQVKRIPTYYQKSTNQHPQTQQCLYVLLSNISKDRNKDTIRIYKDDFAKIYTHRYGRDKITNFFDYEYIEDYGSLLRLFTESVLQFRVEEVMLMSFMMLDFDNDGLISHSDLFKMLTILDKNMLVKKTIYTILKYVKQNANNQAIRDVCHEEYLRKENYTLKKYQFMVYMKDKKKTEGEDKQAENQPKESSLRMNESKKTERKSTGRQQRASPLGRYFSLKKDTQQNNRQFAYLKSFIQSMAKASQPGAGHFQINFQRFKSLYPSSVPQIYYDMLYAAFGLKMPGIQYSELDYETPLIKTRKVTYVEEVKQLDVIEEKMRGMRATRREINQRLIKPDIKRHRRIMTMLD